MKKILILIFTISFFSCKAQTKDTYSICDTALAKISRKDYKGFRNMFHVAILKNASDEAVINIVDQCSALISKYGLPTKESILIKHQIANSNDGPINVILLDYPFPAPKEKYSMPERVISFGFTEKFGMDSLSAFNFNDYSASDSLMTAQMPKIPFLRKLKFDIKDISWFRIYYSKGNSDKKIGNEDGVFAVSGDKDKLESLKIKNDFKNIFRLLEKAKLEKTNYKYGGAPKNNGRPEYIYYRFKFSTPPTEKFDELTIYIVINEEKGIKEDDYIFVSHNQMNRYYISKSNNPDLFNALKNLAFKDYANKTEKDP